jgi:CDGSH-type Zn-finger protein
MDHVPIPESAKKPPDVHQDSMKITVLKNGPFLVTGGVPLTAMEIRNDHDGFCRYWVETKQYPAEERYTLCRCGRSKNKPFCDGSHAKFHFHGTETAGTEPYLGYPDIARGPGLELEDYVPLCARARFCVRAGGIWKLTEQSGNPEARETAIEEAGNCPSGRLVVRDPDTDEPIEPELEKSIAVVEYPARNEQGPLWVRGGIPVVSSDGKTYTIRNRVSLCRCGRSHNMPFCDGSHAGK